MKKLLIGILIFVLVGITITIFESDKIDSITAVETINTVDFTNTQQQIDSKTSIELSEYQDNVSLVMVGKCQYVVFRAGNSGGIVHHAACTNFIHAEY